MTVNLLAYGALQHNPGKLGVFFQLGVGNGMRIKNQAGVSKFAGQTLRPPLADTSLDLKRGAFYSPSHENMERT